ncbi:hypothetical protein [Nonomuraea typhae]|uniref:Uncharacterized protein n=1 Tax=Nonomuraea typhae TaxID=2603600 RepID=A0ABW7YSM3_9ACTN
MERQAALDHYLSLLANYPWLRVELCWAVIESKPHVLEEHELGDRLALGHPWEIRRGQLDEFSDDNVVHISYARQRAAFLLLEIGYHVSRPDVLSMLSRNADVTYVHWNVEGANQLAQIANGQSVWSVDIFDADEWPSQVFHESPLFDLFRMTSNARAASMAIVDLMTGVRLENEFIEGTGSGFVFSYFPFQPGVR